MGGDINGLLRGGVWAWIKQAHLALSGCGYGNFHGVDQA